MVDVGSGEMTRTTARNLLAGKIAGIGLLGLTQIVLGGLAALIATAAVGSVNLFSVRTAVVDLPATAPGLSWRPLPGFVGVTGRSFAYSDRDL
jgi:ABC-type Na+ efflux pump permease subunit